MDLGINKQTENITDEVIWNEALLILNDHIDDDKALKSLGVRYIRKLIEKKLNTDLKSKHEWLKEKLTLWINEYLKKKEDELEKKNQDLDDQADDEVDDQADDEVDDDEVDDEVDDESEDEDDISINSDVNINDLDDINDTKNNTNSSKINLENIINTNNVSSEDDLSSDEDDNEFYLQKLNNNDNDILHYHKETLANNYNEILNFAKITKDDKGIIVDPLHKTLPILTKYEYTRIIGQRSKQIEEGALPFIKVDENIIDPYFIAKKELENKKLPFIIKRPLPCSGFEYWHLEDLEIL